MECGFEAKNDLKMLDGREVEMNLGRSCEEESTRVLGEPRMVMQLRIGVASQEAWISRRNQTQQSEGSLKNVASGW